MRVRTLSLTPGGLLPLGELQALCATLESGACVVLPADTGYMMAVDALSESAIAHLYAIKGRPEMNPVHVAVASLAQAEALAELSDTALKLARAFLPGPMTIVGPKREIVPDVLVARSGTVGFRIPDAPVVLQVCAAYGRPLTATSTNRSGLPPLWEVEAIRAELGEEIEILVEARGFHSRVPSTVVKVIGDEIKILRPGQIGAEAMAQAMAKTSAAI